MPPDRGDDGQHGARRIAEVTRDELAFEFESDDEEEDRQQAVGGPPAERQVAGAGTRGADHDGPISRGRHPTTASSPTPAPPPAASSSSAPPTVSWRRMSDARDLRPRTPGQEGARAIHRSASRSTVGAQSPVPARSAGHQPGCDSHRSAATHSTWWVSGNASNTRSRSTRVAVPAVQPDVAGECRCLTADVDHPRHTGAGDQVDDLAAGPRPRRVEHGDVGAVGSWATPAPGAPTR